MIRILKSTIQKLEVLDDEDFKRQVFTLAEDIN